MKEIKALMHKNRVASVIEELTDQGYLYPANPRRCLNLNVVAVIQGERGWPPDHEVDKG